VWSPRSSIVPAACGSQVCKPFCKPDTTGQGETGKTQQTTGHIAFQICRDQRSGQRRSETAETHVVWLITQRSEVQILPPLPRPEAVPQTEGRPFACGLCTELCELLEPPRDRVGVRSPAILPAEQHPRDPGNRPEFASLLVENLDMRLETGQSERVERQYMLSVLGLAVRLDHPAVHDHPRDLDR
jgi:hypothetical protein